MLLLGGRATAKPSCEAALRLVHRAIEDHGLLPLRANEGLYLMAFAPATLRSRLATRIRESVAAKNQTTAAFMDSEFGAGYGGPAVRDIAALNADKRLTGEFKTTSFLLIDTLESLLGPPGAAAFNANLALVRSILSLRIRERRPTLVLLDAIENGDRYLRGLPDDAKTEGKADKK